MAAAIKVDVCMLTTAFPRFSGDLFGAFVHELARELVKQGLSVQVIAPHDSCSSETEILDGVRVTRFRYMIPDSLQRLAYGGGIPSNLKSSWVARLQVPLFLFSFWRHARRAVKGSRLFHCHWTISALVARLACLGRRRPIVLSVRGSDVKLFGHGVLGILSRLIYRWTDCVMPVSTDIAQVLENCGVPASKLTLVSNGVGARFRPLDRHDARIRLSLPQERKLVLYVGLLVPVKGLWILLEALEKINDTSMTCLLVGQGHLQPDLTKRVEGSDQLRNRVQFMGPRSSQEIPLWMNAADMLVLPSLSEGRPNVVLEAQACGTPVVATDVGGTSELIVDGVDGLLVAPGDAEALSLAIEGLSLDSSLRDDIGRAALGRVRQSGLTWEEAALKTKIVYERAKTCR